MAGNYLSVIVLFDAWQDAGRGAATAPLIRLRIALGFEEKKGRERKEGRGRKKRESTK